MTNIESVLIHPPLAVPIELNMGCARQGCSTLIGNSTGVSGAKMDFLDAWRQRATQVTSGWRDAGRKASERVSNSVSGGLSATASVAGEAYTAALDWKNNSEFSNWLTDHLSNQHATLASKALEAKHLRTHTARASPTLYH